MPSLEKAQKDAADKQLAIAGGPTRGKADARPAQENHRIEPARADPVGDNAGHDPTHGEGQAESGLEPAVVAAGQVEGG